MVEGQHPWTGLGRPEDIADAALFLAGDEASWYVWIDANLESECERAANISTGYLVTLWSSTGRILADRSHASSLFPQQLIRRSTGWNMISELCPERLPDSRLYLSASEFFDSRLSSLSIIELVELLLERLLDRNDRKLLLRRLLITGERVQQQSFPL